MYKKGLFILLVLPLSCFSQFNDSIHYHVRLASTGVINKAKEGDSYVLNNAFSFNVRMKKLTYNTYVGWVYGAQQHNLTNNDFTAHGDVDFLKGIKKLYYWGLVNYDKSYSLNINYRLQAGAGLAYHFIDSPQLRINVSDGLLYEQGDLLDANLNHDIYQIPRNSFRLLYRWSFRNRLFLDGTHFFQPSLKDYHDYIIQSSNNISVKLKQWLSITASAVYNKVSRTNRENLYITYGITLEKYF